MRRHYILIPLAALIVTLPLLLHGCSCGHDFDFHMLSWLEAASQFRHGTLHPHWAFSPAFNAGEPRFIFYPPLSWTLGALLTMLFPIRLVPALYTFFALTAAGFTMHRLARYFASPTTALLAAVLYIANPYMLFNAFERTAYAELLAAAWLPLLFLAALRKRPSIAGIALPIALLWLTNAPAAVMGCYTFAAIVLTRLIANLRLRTLAAESPSRLALTATAGTLLGLALAAFYLLPAAYERRFIQVAMAIIPNMRFEDNFLFGHTADAGHNVVLHTASLLAVTLLAATVIALATSYLLARTRHNPVILSEAHSEKPKNLHRRPLTTTSHALPTTILIAILSLITLCIAFLLTPLSTPLWNHLPELAFLQFPWRLLSILAVILALAIAALPSRNTLLLQTKPATTSLTFALVAALTLFANLQFRQGCETKDLPVVQAEAFAQHQGVEATDEYTPIDADNDVLRADDPPFFLAADPAAFAPGTTPNPAATDPNFAGPQPRTRASQAAPTHFTIDAPQPETLILNLRDYPAWQVTQRAGAAAPATESRHIQRDDGLLAIAVPAGPSLIDITWRPTLDQRLGIVVSFIAFLIFATLCLMRIRVARSRRIKRRAS